MFGAVVAGLIPLLMAIVSIVIALGLTALLAQPFELSIFIVNMLTGMGLALGIDYSLFVVSRYREERARGLEKLDAIAASGATASRAVVFSGTAFVVAMFGMLLVPSSIMRSLAVGAILVGIVSVVAATTLLPALLGLLGDRVNALRIPFIGRRTLESAGTEGRFWGAIVRSVLRRPVLSLVLSTGLLVALALPILAINIGTSGVSALPDRFVSKQGFLALERDFPEATTDPVEIVVAGGASRAEVSAALDRAALDARGRRSFRQRRDSALRGRRGRGPLGAGRRRPFELGGGRSRSRAPLGDSCRRRSPATEAEVLVGGTTSENIDYFESVIDPAPLVIGLVLVLTFLLLTVVFRSVVIAGNGGGAEPPLGRRPRTGCSCSSSSTGSERSCSGSRRSTRSRPGCRCSSSRCSSGSRWTTRCSCSPASRSATTRRATRPTRSSSASARPRGSSPGRR